MYDSYEVLDCERMHSLDKRLATINKEYRAFVTNKFFTDYFGFLHSYKLTELVHPEEQQDLTAFIDSFAGEKIEKLFRFCVKDGTYRYNFLKLLSGKKDKDTGEYASIDIELLDVGYIERVNEHLSADVSRLRTFLGLTSAYAFSYSNINNVITIFRYERHRKVNVYEMDIDLWKKYMLKEGIIASEDSDKFAAMIEDIKNYVENFSVCINSSIRTQGEVLEPLRFCGMVHHGVGQEYMAVGRILAEDAVAQQKVIEMIDELHYDSLTKVYNKKSITEYANKMLREQLDNNVNIIIVDVDHFKAVNDTYGHLCGDKVLSRIGCKLKEIVGEYGNVGRIGGDEFMIVLHGIKDSQLLRSMLRAIRTQIKWEFTEEFTEFMLSVSIGAASAPYNGTEFEDLFAKADYCLYIAKEKGRDRYVFFRDDLHGQSYEEFALSQKQHNAGNKTREVQELKVISSFMQKIRIDGKAACIDIIRHIMSTYNIDTMTVFSGDDLKRVHTIGQKLENANDAMYAKTEEFKRLLDGKNYIQTYYIGRLKQEAPVFSELMRRRGVLSTLQCIIGTADDVRAVISLDKCKESGQWAEYEIESASILAAYISAELAHGIDVKLYLPDEV